MRKLVALLLTMLMFGALLAMPAAAEDYVKLTWVQGTGADAPVDAAIVGEALNKITREKLGCEVEIIYMTNDQVTRSILAGEIYDMYFTCDWYNDFFTQVYAGVFADITGLIETVTPDLYATMPEIVWELAKVNGKSYSIPVKKDYAPEIFAIFDKELFAKLGMEIPAEMDYLDLEPYLAAQKAEYPDRYPLMLSGASANAASKFNFINRPAGLGFPYSAVETENATKIISLFEDEEYIARVMALRDWYLKGYINPDAATINDIDNKQNFLKFGQGFYGADSIWSSSYQYPVQISKVSGPYLSVLGVCGSMNAFNAALESDPARLELCLKYQELVNTDLEYRDMLRYGIEGLHFNYNADGTVSRTDAGNNYRPWPFAQGSYALSSVEASNFPSVPADPNMWNVVFEGYKKALVAADHGFAFDPTPVEMEVAQLVVIKEKWLRQIETGSVDPAEALPAVIAEMEAAGLRDVIKEAQAQLDAHLASLN